jgi:predicted AAA+ superfamily ATPase
MRAKHYFFDVGVVNNLTKRGKISYKSELFGRALEHFIALELRAYLSYHRLSEPLQYWRSTSQFEVDFIIGDRMAIEVKATDLVTEKHLKGLRALREENLISTYCVVSLDAKRRKMDGDIIVWPVSEFLKALWSGSLLAD